MKKLFQPLLFVCAVLSAGTACASVTFYEGDGFTGHSFTTYRAVADLRAFDFNDRAMSMVVEGEPIEVCADVNFGGKCQAFNPGSYPSLLDSGWTRAISSVRPAYVERSRDRRDRPGRDRYDRRN